MKKLVFKLEYAGKILTGEKTTTIRLNTDLREGEIVEVYVGHVRIGRAIIKSIKKKKLDKLTEEEIKTDGFSSREALIKELSKIYGRRRISNNPDIYIIEFKLI